MERIILIVIRSIFQLPFWIYKIFKYCNVDKYPEEIRYNFLHKLTTLVNKRGRVTVSCYGLEHLPKDNGYIMYGNHQGLFDALILLQTHTRPFTTVSKMEVKNVFFIKQVFTILQSKFIDREDVRQSMKVMIEVTKEVKEGRNYLIFPEGTRSKNGNHLGEFKGGSFKSAMNAKCPIVPIAIIDSFKSFDTHSIKKLNVQVHYLKPLYYDDYKEMKSGEIASLVASRIEDTIREYETAQTI
jgi:1-acyl-sn-glycerol-3-phosphate acyltransferase